MRIRVNGEERDVAAGATVADVVAAFGPAGAGERIAVALNGEVARRGEWAETTVAEGDRVELLAAMQGGAARPPARSAQEVG